MKRRGPRVQVPIIHDRIAAEVGACVCIILDERRVIRRVACSVHLPHQYMWRYVSRSER